MAQNSAQGNGGRRRGAHFASTLPTIEETPAKGGHGSFAGYETLDANGNPYAVISAAPPKKRRRSCLPIILVLLLALAGLAVGGWFLYQEYMRHFDVTINGQALTVEKGDTIQRFFDEGLVSPKPGKLIAIDGSVIDEAGGEAHTITMNGQPAQVTTELVKDAKIDVGDGADITEDSTVSEETIPASTAGVDATFEVYWEGAIHLLSDGTDGYRRVRTGAVSGIQIVEEERPAVPGGYQVYTAHPDDKVIALTFDDGPWPETTAQILDILAQYGAHATFFTIGEQIPWNTELIAREHAEGHEVLTHTWDHANGSGQGVNITFMSAEEQIWELQQGYAAIKDVTGEEPPHIFRAPGGNFYGDAVTNLWPYLDAEIGWDLDTEDWTRPGADAIAQVIMSAQPGQVVLMHDGGGDRTQTVEALRQAMPYLVDQGYKFVTVSELLAYGMPS